MKYQRVSNQPRALFILYIQEILFRSYSLVGKLLLLLMLGCMGVFINAIFLSVCALMADCNSTNNSAELVSLSFNFQVYFFICSQSSYFSMMATFWALISLLISFVLPELLISSFLILSQTSYALLNYCLLLASCLQRVCQVGSDGVARWRRLSCSCFFWAQRVTPLSNALESLEQRECIYFWQISSSSCSFKQPYTPLSEIGLLFYF